MKSTVKKAKPKTGKYLVVAGWLGECCSEPHHEWDVIEAASPEKAAAVLRQRITRSHRTPGDVGIYDAARAAKLLTARAASARSRARRAVAEAGLHAVLAGR